MLGHLAAAADSCQRLAQVIVKSPAAVSDANGRPAPNPLTARYERAVKHLLASCTEFGLTQSSRERAHAERFHEVEDDIAGGPSR